jgi:hypothetical protein
MDQVLEQLPKAREQARQRILEGQLVANASVMQVSVLTIDTNPPPGFRDSMSNTPGAEG